ncbi:MAG: DNA-directed RNA polymerase subunit D [Candidatus ainarchaeum sp.]|nr:DNA-directed RNA polymerase subunit D [Candidatus ainarchaeum sp.]
MKLEIKKEEGNKLNFELGDVNTSFANAVRRYVMKAVPVFAMQDVTFYENSSPIFDEYISHRIGLIPLFTPEGVPKEAEITFYLDAKGPKVVYSEELESKDKEVKVARGKNPVITLADGQALRLEGKSVLRTAENHAKFQPGIAAYEISGETYKFVVESFFQMPPRELVMRALSILESDLETLQKQLQKVEKASKKK